MKHISTILSVIALALVGVLFYLFAHHNEQIKHLSASEQKAPPSAFRIAYFDMDTLEAHYEAFKDAQRQMKEKENAASMELSSLDRSNQKKVDVWRAKGNAITQAEAEQAQQEIQQMQQSFQARKNELDADVYKSAEDMKAKIHRKVEDYLKEFNKQGKYAFIFAYDPSTIIYYKDSVYDVTNDVVSGLNAAYADEKKKN